MTHVEHTEVFTQCRLILQTHCTEHIQLQYLIDPHSQLLSGTNHLHIPQQQDVFMGPFRAGK